MTTLCATDHETTKLDHQPGPPPARSTSNEWSFAAERRRAHGRALALRNEARAGARAVARRNGLDPDAPPAPQPRPLLLYITCPRCGAPVDVQARGVPLAQGRMLRSILRCTAGCRPEVITLAAGFTKADDWPRAAENRRGS